RLKGRNIGLVTNHTGRDRRGRATADVLHAAEGVKLVALFSPEHGIRGELDQSNITDATDAKTGLPVYSLYGKRRKPDAETLKGIDTLVYDIQDIGCRFYTYISTLGLVLESAAENKVKLVVLDRPNPIGGLAIDGPLTDAGRESFIAYHSLPIRHGMTVGELAKLFVAERKLNVELEVVKCEGWKRGDFFDRTGLTSVNPSPTMRNRGPALPRDRAPGDDQPEARPRDGAAVRVDRGALARRPEARGRTQCGRSERGSIRLRQPDSGVQRSREEAMRRGADHCGRLEPVQPASDRADRGRDASRPVPGPLGNEKLRPAPGSQGELRRVQGGQARG